MGYEDLLKIDYDMIVNINKIAARIPPEKPCSRIGVKNISTIINAVNTIREWVRQGVRPTGVAAVAIKCIGGTEPQPFHDCNRRTSLLLGATILEDCGYVVNATLGEGEELAEKLMRIGLPELERWIIDKISRS